MTILSKETKLQALIIANRRRASSGGKLGDG